MTDGGPDVSPQQLDEKWRAYPDTTLEFESRSPLCGDLRELVTHDV